jgi:hypothetical protein
MTDAQFEQLMVKLEEINQNVALITSKKSGKEFYNLGDLFHEFSTLESAINNVESAVNNSKP